MCAYARSFVHGRVIILVVLCGCAKPDEIVRYQPGFWEMIKYGWVQYLSIFFVVRYFLSMLEVRCPHKVCHRMLGCVCRSRCRTLPQCAAL